MRKTEYTSRFRRDLKRERRGVYRQVLQAELNALLLLLQQDLPLPVRCRDHALTGEWVDHRDCHVRPDLVLIYRKIGTDRLELVRLGSHSELQL